MIGFLISWNLMAQDRYTISGSISDGETGEVLIGATLYVESLKTGTAANEYGFYSLTMPAGTYDLIISYLGYRSENVHITLEKDSRRDFLLNPVSEKLEEVVVQGTRGDANIRSSEMSISHLNMKEVVNIPVLFGEQDVLKTIQLLPGVQSAGEGSTGFYVRGGDAGQNMILLDEAPVYNPSHLLGFFSVFNSDAISDVKLYKGGIPAEYGGRVSSVLDVRMKNGDMKKISISGGLGLISSRLMLEGPIKKDKGSFVISGRRTYADVFLLFAKDTLIRNNTLFFYDFNLKANYKIGKNDRFYLSGYFGRDVFLFQNRFGLNWGNVTGTIRWNHLFNNRLFLNSSFIYSNYNYTIGLQEDESKLDIQSAILDFNWKEDFQYYLNPENTIKFGGKINYHNFLPGVVTSQGNFQINDLKLSEKHALETALYISHKYKPAEWLSLNYGLRIPVYWMVGPGDIYSYDGSGNVQDTTHFESLKPIVRYATLEPRFSANFNAGPVASVKVSYNRISQYIHLLSNSTSESPTDIWIPSSPIVKPQLVNQFAAGYFRNFKENEWETSVELYYKGMKNQIDYKNGADILLNEQVESQLEFGNGRSYGLEFFVKKNRGKLHGWVSYTLARSLRKFENINGGNYYPARQDRVHDLSIVGIFDLNERWSVSGTWVYFTGNAVTFPSGKYTIEGKTVNYYTERNGYRMPNYHRLDVSATYTNKKKRKSKSSWNFSVYNVYARKNAWAINFEPDEKDPSKTNAVRLSLFSIIPSITYNFKF